jgi:hypothetical protein
MKRIAGAFLAIVLIAGTSCQQAVDIEKEKEAILAILHAESDATLAKDAEGLFAQHMQDEMETRLEMGQYGYNSYEGWEEVKSLLGDFLEGTGEAGGVEDLKNTKENVRMKVTGNTAWLVCDNKLEWTSNGVKDGYSNLQIVFFEKEQGEWKISFAAYYSPPKP